MKKKDYQRTERLATLMQREMALLIQTEMKDPRLGIVTISAVEVTRDLSYGKIYVSILGEGDEVKKNIRVLNQAAGFFRTQLAQRIKVRKMPQLIFIHDNSIPAGMHMSKLIDDAISEDEKFMIHDPDGLANDQKD
jgi:ribosome-binding factor A